MLLWLGDVFVDAIAEGVDYCVYSSMDAQGVVKGEKVGGKITFVLVD